MALLPEPLSGGKRLQTLKKAALRTEDDLARWMSAKGVETATWGQDKTKTLNSLYEEIKGDEALLEMWQTTDGKEIPVRVTHVLRAKVTSPEGLKRQVYLFNTWQQFGDGRKRTRNGLLSEKLTVAEMPFEAHIHEICVRAVTEEEMARVVDASFKVEQGSNKVAFDAAYVCPIKVVTERLNDHTIEVSASASYPGLLTMYHLYTVDIICMGLPRVDFNTLEFTHKDDNGDRELKYMHAWTWLEWPQIKRYLFEGSKMKENKKKGSFENPEELRLWLSQYNLDLEEWGSDKYRDVKALYEELESRTSHVEVWGRQDGVPLIMRVVHVLQMRMISCDPRQGQRFLIKKWIQDAKGNISHVDRPLSKALIKGTGEISEETLKARAVGTVNSELKHVFDQHFDYHEINDALEDGEPSGIEPVTTTFLRHWYDLEESPSFKNMYTMYHLYAVDVECKGLPTTNFTSVQKDRDGELKVHAWHWTTWDETTSAVYARYVKRERHQRLQTDRLENTTKMLSNLANAVNSLSETPDLKASGKLDIGAMKEHLERMQKEMWNMQSMGDSGNDIARMFPPSMISKITDNSLVPMLLQDRHAE